MNRPIYFQLPSTDPARLVQFYHTVFGWATGSLKQLDNVWVLVTGDPSIPGLNGMVMGKIIPCTVNIISVDDIDAILEKVEQYGGKVINAKHRIKDLGIYAWCEDSDANPFVVMQNGDELISAMLSCIETPIPDPATTSRPIHFEIPASDQSALAGFYAGVFDWTVEKWQGSMNYTFVMTGSLPAGGIDGALMDKENNRFPVNVLNTDDIDKIIDKVTQAGGSILMPKEHIPGVGWFAYALDPDGNQFGLMQFDQHPSMPQ